MMTLRRSARAMIGALIVGLAVGGCAAVGGDGASVPPGASQRATEADAVWMAGMAEHHDQAVALARLAPGRAEDAEVLASAERIATTQEAEAAALRAWLDRRGLDESALGGHRSDRGPADMPGEISATAFTQAEAATGAAFDRLFVDTMARHHEGAVSMCEQRLEASGDPAVARWARTVSTGQAIELDRLIALAGRLP